MSTDSDFEDPDYGSTVRTQPPGAPAPTREELDARLTGAQQELTRLQISQEQIQREIQAVEEQRRKRAEFSRGLDELKQNLARAVGLLDKAELQARRDADRLSAALQGVRSAAASIAPLKETEWTSENWESELNHALTLLDTARMEYNSARAKCPVLDDPADGRATDAPGAGIADLPLGKLLRLGLAMTWPLVIPTLLALVMLAVLVFRR